MQRNFFDELPTETVENIFDYINLEYYPSLSHTCSRFSLFAQPIIDAAKQHSLKLKTIEAEAKSLSRTYKEVLGLDGISTHCESVLKRKKIKELISKEPDSELSKLLLKK